MTESETRTAAGGRVGRRLEELGLILPTPPSPVARYRPFVRHRGLIFVSGQAPSADGVYRYVGRVGDDLSFEDGVAAARLCALNLLAVVAAACDGDLDQVEKVLSLRGFVNAEPGFEPVPQVINGASELLLDVFGEAIGGHARTAVGCSALPSNVAVEVDAVFALRDES